jgi:hypothetical protein
MDVKMETSDGGGDGDNVGDGDGGSQSVPEIKETDKKKSDKVQVRSMALKSDGQINTFLCIQSFHPPFFLTIFPLSFFLTLFPLYFYVHSLYLYIYDPMPILPILSKARIFLCRGYHHGPKRQPHHPDRHPGGHQ